MVARTEESGKIYHLEKTKYCPYFRQTFEVETSVLRVQLYFYCTFTGDTRVVPSDVRSQTRDDNPPLVSLVYPVNLTVTHRNPRSLSSLIAPDSV